MQSPAIGMSIILLKRAASLTPVADERRSTAKGPRTWFPYVIIKIQDQISDIWQQGT